MFLKWCFLVLPQFFFSCILLKLIRLWKLFKYFIEGTFRADWCIPLELRNFVVFKYELRTTFFYFVSATINVKWGRPIISSHRGGRRVCSVQNILSRRIGTDEEGKNGGIIGYVSIERPQLPWEFMNNTSIVKRWSRMYFSVQNASSRLSSCPPYLVSSFPSLLLLYKKCRYNIVRSSLIN